MPKFKIDFIKLLLFAESTDFQITDFMLRLLLIYLSATRLGKWFGRNGKLIRIIAELKPAVQPFFVENVIFVASQNRK